MYCEWLLGYRSSIEGGHPERVEQLVRHRLRKREFFIGNLLVRIHFVIVMIRWTGLAPWEFEFRFTGSLTSTFLVERGSSSLCATACGKSRVFRGGLVVTAHRLVYRSTLGLRVIKDKKKVLSVAFGVWGFRFRLWEKGFRVWGV